MEGRAALAFWDERLDELVFYNSTQMPHQVRYALSLHLDLEERQIHVIAPDVGGGFGIKNIVYPEEIAVAAVARHLRSEEHTSELQSLMRISYAVFCLKKKTNQKNRYKEKEKHNKSKRRNNKGKSQI